MNKEEKKEKKDYNPGDYKPESSFQSKRKSGFWRTFFIVIGVIAAIIIIMIIGALIALIVIKPYGLDITKLPAILLDSDKPSSYDHPLLSTEQEKILESMGVDTASLPTTITPAQEQCATEVLGADRVNEIKAGATPSVTDYLKAKDCF